MKTMQTILSKTALSLPAGEWPGVRASLLLFWLLLAATPAFAAVRYVNLNNLAPAPPYSTWTSAATNIQDAIDAADDGDQIVVTNGVYQTGGRVVDGAMTNRVVVTKALTVRSVNGPEVTVIAGYQVPGTTHGDSAVRCVYLTNGAALIGFTLTNGATRVGDCGFDYNSGAGVWCESASVVISNCVLTGNSAWGGGFQGTLNDCTLTGNSAQTYGGGVSLSTLNNCTLRANSAQNGFGGGAYYGTLNNCALASNCAYDGGGAFGGTLNKCTLTGNSAAGAAERSGRGGGAAGLNAESLHIPVVLNICIITSNSAGIGGGVYYGTLSNCIVTGNSAEVAGGGASGGMLINCSLNANSATGQYANGGGVADCTLNNCSLIDNSADYLGGGAFLGTLDNCTLSSNSAYYSGGGVYGGTLNNCTLTGNSAEFGGGASGRGGRGGIPGILNNCILYNNTAIQEGANYDSFYSFLNYSCTTPSPDTGTGNITNAPAFADYASGNLRLQSNSPCINAGLNPSASGGTDLDGHARIVGGTVDVGAYAFPSPQSLISYAWLQQYGLPIVPSTDSADPDGDRLNNWQEWRAGTNPTNAQSVLRLLTPTPLGPDLVVTWESVPSRSYALEGSPNLSARPPFAPLASHLPADPFAGTTTFTHTNAAGLVPLFFRVRVEE